MKFLFPGFLFALLVTIVPLIIHLFNFRRIKKVYFSNVSFLKEIEQKSAASRKVKHLLILAMRILALVFLVLAFAQPYIPSGNEAAAPGQQQIVSIYIDNSYSMELSGKEGSLLDEAKRRAKEIASAYPVNTLYQLLTNDFEGKDQRLLDLDDFFSAVDEVKTDGGSRSVQQIINRQAETFSQKRTGIKIAWLISDFQRTMLPSGNLKTDPGVAYNIARLQAPVQPNISIDSAWFASPVHRTGNPERLIVRLKNSSDKKAGNIPIALTIGGQRKAIGNITIPPRGTLLDTLSFSNIGQGWQRGELSISDYPLTFDNRFFFSFFVRGSVRLLVINSREENAYINAVYAAEPFFLINNRNFGNINYSQLASYPLIILNGTDNVTNELAGQLAAYVKDGGTLLVYPSVNGDLSGLNTLTGTLGIDIPEAVGTGEAKVTGVNFRHPIFKGVFEMVPRNADLPLARKYILYRKSGRIRGNTIMQLPAGRSFFSHYPLGKGSVLLSAVALTEESSNLVRHSFFVPLMYQSAFLSLRDKPLSLTVGKEAFFGIDKVMLPASQTLRLKNERLEIIPDVRQTENATEVFVADQVKEAGQYNLFKGDSLLAVVSFNDNRVESDLSYASGKEVAGRFSAGKVKVYEEESGPLKNTVKAANYGVQLWKLCLILTLVFLAAEILLLRFYGRKRETVLQEET